MGDISEETISGGTAAQNVIHASAPVTPRPQRQRQRLEQQPLTQTPALSTIPAIASKYDLDALVPETGETFGTWIQRRIEKTYGAGLPAHLALSLAGSSATDEDLDGLISAACAIYGKQMPLELQRTVDEVSGSIKEYRKRVAAQKRAETEEQKRVVQEGQLNVAVAGGAAGLLNYAMVAPPDVLEAIDWGYSKIVSPALTMLIDGLSGRGDLDGDNLSEIYRSATTRSPGQQLARSYELRPGTAPYKLMSATADAVFRWYADPFVIGAKLKKGAELAETVALTAKGEVPQVAKSALTQWNFARKARRLEELVTEGVGKDRLDEIWGIIDADRAAGAVPNVNRIRSEFGLPARVAENLAASESRAALTENFIAMGYGKIIPQTRPVLEARVREIGDELAGLSSEIDSAVPSQATVDDVVGMLRDAKIRAVTERARTLTQEYKFLSEQLIFDTGDALIGRIPERAGRLARAFRRGGDTAFEKFVNKIGEKRWLRQVFDVLPNEPISVKVKDQGVEQLTRLGRLLDMPEGLIDGYANKYISATSKGEVTELVQEMLKVGGDSLPAELRSELTRYTMHPSQSVYAVDRYGQTVKNFFKTVGRKRYNQPLIPTHLADAVPLPNTFALAEAKQLRGKIRQIALRSSTSLKEAGLLARTELRAAEAAEKARVAGKVLTAAEREALRTGPERAGLALAGFGQRGASKALRGATELSRLMDHITTLFTTIIWKPAVLMRVGYPLRVVSEEQLRMTAMEVPSLYSQQFAYFNNRKIWKEMLAKGTAPEEVMSNMARDITGSRVAGKGVIFWGEPGSVEALQTTLIEMASDPLTSRILRNGSGDAIRWLKEGKGQKYLADHLPILRQMEQFGPQGASVEQWVDAVASWIDDTAPLGSKLRSALERGKVGMAQGDVSLTDNAFRDWLKGLDPSEAPEHVKNIVDYWRIQDGKYWRRFTGRVLNVLGSKPTNALSRGPTFVHFFEQEKTFLRGRMGSANEKLIEKLARQTAIEKTNTLLYKMGERTAFHQATKNIAPFLGAWQEVVQRWGVTIPTQIGGGGPLGWLRGATVMERRANALFQFLKDTDQIGKNDDGHWVLRNPHISKFLAAFYGIKGQEAEFELRRFNFAAGFPFSGPVASQTIARLFRKNESALEFFRWTGMSPDSQFGPAWVARAWVGVTGAPPPWEWMSAEHQEHLFNASVIDVARYHRKDFKALYDKELAPLLDAKTHQPLKGKENDYRLATERVRERVNEMYEDFRAEARMIYLKRAATGLLAPIQPRLFWPQEKEMAQFWEIARNLPAGEKKSLLDRLLEDRPEMATFLVSKGVRIKGEQEREFSQDQYWLDVAKGEILRRDPKEAVQLMMGMVEESIIRQTFKERQREIGTDAVDYLKNAGDYFSLQAEKRAALAALGWENPTWDEERNRSFERAAIKEGRPLPSFEEEKIMELGRALSVVEALTRDDDPKGEGWREAHTLLNNLKSQYGIDRFYSQKELPAGPERDMAEWFEKVYEPYKAKVKELLDRDFRSPEERSHAFEELRRYRNSLKPYTKDGKTYPTPEEFGWSFQDSEQKEVTKARWAAGKIEYLTRFQRKTLGIQEKEYSDGSTPGTLFWDAVNDARLNLRDWARDKHIITQSKEYRAAKDRLEVWEEGLARYYNVADEYKRSKQPPYKRAQYLGIGAATLLGTHAMVAADNFWRTLEAKEQSPGSKAGRYLLDSFNSYIYQLRAYSPVFADSLDALQASFKRFEGGPQEPFYNYFFFGIGD